MIRRIATLCIAAAASAALVCGQGMGRRNAGGTPGTPPDPAAMIQRRVDMLAKLLDLTDQQKTQATGIFTAEHTAAAAVQPQVQTARQAFRDAVKKHDNAGITTAAGTVGNLTGQLLAIQGKADADFYAVLTPDQQAKFDALPMGRMMGGPGGRPGPMGPMGAGGEGWGGPHR